MKIQECYVENFGGLSGYHFCPEEPLEYLCAPNGSGKTTFAAFVCAMFYGLGSARTRKNLEEVPLPFGAHRYSNGSSGQK